MEQEYFRNKSKNLQKKIRLMKNHKYFKFQLNEENKTNNNQKIILINKKLFKKIAQCNRTAIFLIKIPRIVVLMKIQLLILNNTKKNQMIKKMLNKLDLIILLQILTMLILLLIYD